MSILKSVSDHLTLNAEGTSKSIKFQSAGVEKASISSAGLFTSTTIDATKLTGILPAIDGSNLTGLVHTDSTKLSLAGGAMTGAITTNSTFDGVDIAVRDAILTSTTTTAGAALPKAGGAMTGAITTNSTFDGVDIAVRDAILTSTTTTAGAALPKAGGEMTGNISHGDNVHARFGTGNDLDIYHDGSASYIKEVGTGNLLLSSDGAAVILQTSQGEKCVEANKDGEVNLYYNNSKKLATSTVGINITGRAKGTLTTDNDGTFDMDASNNFKCTPSTGFTLTFTNVVSQSGFILLVNSGGHTIAAAGTSKVDANLLATITAAGTYLVSYFSDGTNVYLTNSAIYT